MAQENKSIIMAYRRKQRNIEAAMYRVMKSNK